MRIRRFFACLVLVAGLVFGAVSNAAASGTAVYQIAFSANCNNPSVALCVPPVGSGLGGDWGSIRLYSDHRGTAEFTSANHQTPLVPKGATHALLVVQWTLVTSSTPPPDAVFPDANHQYFVISVINIPLPPLTIPATPGHYKFQGAIFGMPGVNYILQINAI